MSASETDTEIDRQSRLVAGLLKRGSIVILSGAGLSTSSGIPDYRDLDGQWKRPQPIDHNEFLRNEALRRRYWARSFLGWPSIGLAHPSRGRVVLAEFERREKIALIITQNVDGLHQKAGSRCVLELHGGLAQVICLSCPRSYPRAEVQDWLDAANPRLATATACAAPDGDADVVDSFHAGFRIPDCPGCGGMLKPDVVFFGDNVPKDRVKRAWTPSTPRTACWWSDLP